MSCMPPRSVLGSVLIFSWDLGLALASYWSESIVPTASSKCLRTEVVQRLVVKAVSSVGAVDGHACRLLNIQALRVFILFSKLLVNRGRRVIRAH